jgi:hypothetical protein
MLLFIECGGGGGRRGGCDCDVCLAVRMLLHLLLRRLLHHPLCRLLCWLLQMPMFYAYIWYCHKRC